MIIDVILDRKDGCLYSPMDFLPYLDDRVYGDDFKYILYALQENSEEKMKEALKKYIDEQGYNPEIKKYVDSVDWIIKG